MIVSLAEDLKLALDRVSFAKRLGLKPDPWQEDLLRSTSERVLLNCCRQSGISTMTAIVDQATLDGSPVAQVILRFMEDKEEYSATSFEMHSKLKVVAAQLGVEVDGDRAWPKAARWLWRRIKEVLPLLVAAGIEASRGRDEAAKQIALRRFPTNDGSNGSRRESGVGKGETHADTAGDDGRSDGGDAANGRSNGSEKSPSNAASAKTADTANRYGDFSEGASTPEQAERIRPLVKEGMSETWARRTVLANSHTLGCGCEVCL